MKSKLNPVQIIGGGFSGLTLAYYLCRSGVAVEIHERSARLGGLIGTDFSREQDVIESAANGLMGDGRVAELFRRLEIEPAKKSPDRKNRFIFRQTPRRFSLNFNETLSLIWGALRLVMHKPHFNANESLKSISDRYFGSAAFEYLIGPALQGVYGTTDLSARLLQNIIQNKNLKSDSQSEADQQARAIYQMTAEDKKYFRGTVAPAKGMQELIDKLEQYIKKSGGVIHLNSAGEINEGRFTAIATSASAAALLLSTAHPRLAGELAKIEYLPLTSVTVKFNKTARKLKGFGCLFPKSEKMNALGVLFNNSIFLNRSDEHTETWIFATAQLNEVELLGQIKSDRARMLGDNMSSTDEIQSVKSYIWPHAIPKYDAKLYTAIDQYSELKNEVKHIYLTGNYLGRIGLAKILEQNERLARKIETEMV